MSKTHTIEQRIVDRIVADLTDRRGLRPAWEDIDSETQKEIKESWRKIIQDELKF